MLPYIVEHEVSPTFSCPVLSERFHSIFQHIHPPIWQLHGPLNDASPPPPPYYISCSSPLNHYSPFHPHEMSPLVCAKWAHVTKAISSFPKLDTLVAWDVDMVVLQAAAGVEAQKQHQLLQLLQIVHPRVLIHTVVLSSRLLFCRATPTQSPRSLHFLRNLPSHTLFLLISLGKAKKE